MSYRGSDDDIIDYCDDYVGGPCSNCEHASGPERHSDDCEYYNMPLWMVERKKKCKHYISFRNY